MRRFLLATALVAVGPAVAEAQICCTYDQVTSRTTITSNGGLTVGNTGQNVGKLTPGATSSTISVFSFGSGGVAFTGGPLAANFTNFGRGNTYALSGSTIDTTKMGLFVNNNLSGVSTAGEIPGLAYFSLSSMNVNAPSTLIDGVDMVTVTGGAVAASAGWQTLSISMNDGSLPTNDQTGGGAGAFVPLQIARRASKNQGGTGLTPSTAFGQNWGVDVVSTVLNGATDLALNNGIEVDIGTQTGGSVMRSAAFQAGHSANHAVQSSMWDYAYLTVQASTTPFLEAWAVGGALSAHAPLDSTGTVFSYKIAQDRTAPANKGVDFNDDTFATCSLCVPGFTVGGSAAGLGSTRIGSLLITPSASGVGIDAAASIGTNTPTISVAGSGYAIGGHNILEDGQGGVYDAASLDGTITSITSVIQQPAYPSLSPPTTLATTSRAPTTGSGAVLNPSWSSNRTLLTLNGSGGKIQTGSGTWTANGSVATSLTSLGPVGSHTTVQEWLTFNDAAGTVRYIPAF